MPSPLISVFVPAYDAEAWVSAALDSVLAQTFTGWEVVTADDGSHDATGAILDRYARRDPRIRAFHNERNLGMTQNWNRCLAEARGEFVIKLDADDVFRPRILELLQHCFADSGVLAAGIRTLSTDEALDPFDGIPGDDAMLRAGIDPYGDLVAATDRWYRIAAHGHQLWASSSFMLRRDLLLHNGGYDERFGCASDTELMWRVLEQPGKVAHVGSVGSLYRMRSGSVSDVYRSHNWLTWEGVAANLLSLSRFGRAHRLPRSLRMHYARLWSRWQDGTRQVPESIETALQSVMRSVPPPPLADRWMTRLRDAVSAG